MDTTATAQQPKWWSGGKSPFNLEYGKLMMWYFLMSDAFTFGAFLISYGSIRFSQNFWADPNVVFNAFPGAGHRNLPLAFVSIMTFILIISSVTMVLAVHAGHKGDKSESTNQFDTNLHLSSGRRSPVCRDLESLIDDARQ